MASAMEPEVINHAIEDAIDVYDAQLRRLLNASVSATYRCSTCGNLAHYHPHGNVKGCKLRHLPDSEYMELITRQRDELAATVKMIADAQDATAENVVMRRRVGREGEEL